MEAAELLEALKKLLPAERLAILEAALRLTREEMGQADQPLSKAERKRQMALAAEALLPDYIADDELTIFTALDSEDFQVYSQADQEGI